MLVYSLNWANFIQFRQRFWICISCSLNECDCLRAAAFCLPAAITLPGRRLIGFRVETNRMAIQVLREDDCLEDK